MKPVSRAAIIAVGSELRRLQHHERIDVADAPPRLGDTPPGLCEEVEAARTEPALIARGEERADVIHAGRSEQRIAQRVTHDVGVGGALEAMRVGDRDAAEHERESRDEPMRVEGRADAELSQAGPHAARAR